MYCGGESNKDRLHSKAISELKFIVSFNIELPTCMFPVCVYIYFSYIRKLGGDVGFFFFWAGDGKDNISERNCNFKLNKNRGQGLVICFSAVFL